jgi:hypothetical protein
MDHFTSRAHHSIFLFVAERHHHQSHPSVRGFKLTRTMELQEERDEHLVSIAWAEYQRAACSGCSTAVDEMAQFIDAADGDDDVYTQLKSDLKTRVSVPTWSTLACYQTTLAGCDLDDAFDARLTDTLIPWKGGASCAGRLVHRTACNVFSGCVEVPLLAPKSEIFLPVPSSGRDRKRPKITTNIIMPPGWYRKNLIGARMHCIEMYRYDMYRICSRHELCPDFTYPDKKTGTSPCSCARCWMEEYFATGSTFQTCLPTGLSGREEGKGTQQQDKMRKSRMKTSMMMCAPRQEPS